MKIISLVLVQFVLGKGFQNLQEDVNGRFFNFTISKIMAGSSKYEGFIKDKCLIKCMEEAVNQFGSTYLFITDDYYHEELLKNLQINFVHSYYTEPGNLSYSNSESFYNVLIFCNKFKIQEVLKKKKPFQAAKFFVLVRNYKEAIEKFDIFWENRLVNVVASYVYNTTVYYYTYFPYCATHCSTVGRPYLLAECNISNGIFSHKEELFPKKVLDLHKCPINITFTENVPSSYFTKKNKLTGWEVDLLNEIFERINGVPLYNILNSKKNVYRTSEGYRRLVENSEIGGGLAVSLKALVKTDFCMYGMSLCTTWIIPKREGHPYSADFLIKVFPPAVWILILLTYFIMASSIKMFLKSGYFNILFKLLPFLLGTSTRTKKTAKTLGALWLWFCLVINAIYQSRFQSTLLVPNNPEQSSSTKEILESNLKILGVSDVITDAIPYFKRRFNLSNTRFRKRKFTYEEWVRRMIIKKDSAFLGFKETALYHLERTQLGNKIYIPENCVIKYLLAFVLKKNSHLTEIIVKLSNRLNENGFLMFFIRKHLSRESRSSVPTEIATILKPLKRDRYRDLPPPINRDKMFVVFMCLAAGVSLAMGIFILELINKWYGPKIKKWIFRILNHHK